MKTVVLVRHGKSSWHDPRLMDHERPLKSRGHKEAPIMADKIQGVIQGPCAFISSHARRAFDTAQHFHQVLKPEIPKIKVDERLYFQGIDQILEAIIAFGEHNNARTILAFGHEPNTSALFSDLTKNYIDHLPTSGVMIADFNCEKWSEVEVGKGESKSVLFPKMFR